VESLSASLQVFSRARDLSRQLYTFCKGGGPDRKAVPLPWLLKDTVQFALSGSNVTAQFTIPEQLWACEVDETQIRQIVDNIVINARQAMPDGGAIAIGARNVEVGAHEDTTASPAGFICISIKDQGCGISREHLSRIFDPFFTTRQQGGGLGLSIASSIVKKHGGSIEVESEPGKGAIFHVYLPAATPAAAEAIASVANAPLETGHGRILVMDDEGFMRDVTSKMLRTAGYDVETVADGNEALRLFKQAFTSGQAYDAVVLDLTIAGGVGGKNIVPKLLFIDPQVKAIASSGTPEDEVIQHPARFGFHGMVLKPYTRHEICQAVQRVLTGKEVES
jgi:CheY-like chemotaxis protein